MKNEALLKELEQLTAAVDEAVKKRTEWMDAHMPDFSEWKVGEHVYDMDSGVMLGTVTELYRYHAKHDWRFDTSMSIEATFLLNGTNNCYDNTSRQPFKCGTREQVENRLKWRLASIR